MFAESLVEKIVDFGNQLLFEDRSTYVCILVLSKRPKHTFSYRYVENYSQWLDSSSDEGRTLPSLLQQYSEKAWILPANDLEAGLLEKLVINSQPLGDVVDVFNGLQTSAEDVFPITQWRSISPQLIEFTKSGHTWQIEKNITRPYLMNSRELVRSYLPVGEDALIIYPYKVASTGEVIYSTKRYARKLSSRLELP